MKRIRRGLKALAENPRSGMSMIVALCASVLLLGLTSSLLYAASLPLARANRKIGRERCSQLASSFAQVLDGELEKYVTEDDDVPVVATNGEQCALPDSGTFYNYTNRVLEDSLYGDYDPADPDSGFFYQTLGGGEETADYGNITVRLKKTDLKENVEGILKRKEPPYDSYSYFSYAERDAGTDKAEYEQFIRYQFTVDVTARLDDDSSHSSMEYYRKDSFQPQYYWNVSNYDTKPDGVDVTTGFQVYWNGSDFYTDRNFNGTSKITPRTYTSPDGSSTWEETVDISYNYYGSDGKAVTTYKRYVPVYEEHSAPEAEGGGGP